MATVPQELPPRVLPAPARLRGSGRWVKRADRFARLAITTGGIAVIVAVLLILILILSESIPLWTGARGHREASLQFATAAADPVLLAFSDPYRETFVVMRSSGLFQQVDQKTGQVLRSSAVEGLNGRKITAAERVAGRDLMALGLEDGRVLLVEGRVRVEFSAGKRFVDLALKPRGETPMLSPGTAVRLSAAVPGDDGAFVIASSGGADLYAVKIPSAQAEEFPGAETPAAPSVRDLSPALAGARVTALALSESGEEGIAGTERGEIVPVVFDGDGGVAPEPAQLIEPTDPARVTALAFLIGGQSLVAADEQGRVSSWFRVRSPDNPAHRPYRKIHVFEPMPAAVSATGVSTRNKGFITADREGRAWLRHNTSEQTVLKLAGPAGPAADAGISPKGDGLLVLSEGGTVTSYAVRNPHPETTLKTLFGKIWYEGYEKPEFVWQSTGGTDDFEPKFSLTPLVYGTLKATFYALLFAVPTAIAAALYTALFARASVRAFVKPITEVMAALPSVVIGFLAGLWLAPQVERTTVGTLLLFPMIPLVVVVAALAIRALPGRRLARIRPGVEIFLLVPVVVLAVFLAYRLGPFVEAAAFGGDFKNWLFESFGQRYDPRNSLIIGFAMGFAVIPIIFTISEDAFSNVPAHLSAGSLALGASRWQTAMRVVVPTASPGVFSAVMIGFGRAVGETMIVLMATGNTPIMEWSIFNGMRTLSANIAVEIPEAPFGGTLYRILFFASALLFIMTFCVNTAAEIVRQRLRKKYEVL